MDTALFSPSSLFHESDDNSAGEDGDDTAAAEQILYVERRHAFPGGTELIVREFSFHQLNANLLWPGTFAFSEWLVENQSVLQGRRILELGSGTGALAIFLQRSFGVDITTSDYDDKDVEENIAYNCRANDLDVFPHVKHTWGDTFPVGEPEWDLIIASDILLCKEVRLHWPLLLMSWRRRIGREDEALFFTGCEDAGLAVEHVGSRVYCISRRG